MDRRDFVRATATGAAASLVASSPVAGATEQEAPDIVVDGLDTSIANEGFLDLLETGGVDCVHKSMGLPETYGAMLSFLDGQADRIVPVTTVAGIRRAKRDGKMSMTFGAQSANGLEAVLTKSPTDTYDMVQASLRAYYELGLRMQGICYNVANVFGGGCLDPEVPLTRPGRRLVEEIHRLRIILDVGGHTGERTSFDAIEISTGVPVVCSHANVHALNPNLRAIRDPLIEAIAETGGLVGITAINDFLVRNAASAARHGRRSPQADLGVYLDQIDHVRTLVGADHVALGPDFVWGWGETYDHRAENSITFPSEVLSSGSAVTVRGFENISELPNVVRGLEERGWPRSDLNKLLGGNWMRVYSQVWGE